MERDHYTQWLSAKQIIAGMLRELRPDLGEEYIDHNAAAIIARLANAEPPILLAYAHELKE